jgi:NAD(P)-dependent dehydrogenase (short-subunit alcohol dehydrogenase family)
VGALAGKVAVVTGAGVSRPGIGNGKATAILFAREGARIVLVDRDPHTCRETQQIIEGEGGTAICLTGDVSRELDCQALSHAAIAAFGQIDILHNNVGISSHGGLLDLPVADWERTFAVNLTSMFLMARACIPAMLETGAGRIINVSSISGVVAGGTPMLAYSVSKAAVLHLTRCIATEFAGRGLRCNAILPGLIDTPMVGEHADRGAYGTADPAEIRRVRDSLSPTGTQGTPWDVARTALFLAGEGSAYVNGQAIAVDGGLTCLGSGVRPVKSNAAEGNAAT